MPVAEILPADGLNDHVTAVFELPATVAVNARVCADESETLPGATDTLISGGDAAKVAPRVAVIPGLLAASWYPEPGSDTTSPLKEATPLTAVADAVPESAALAGFVASESETWPSKLWITIPFWSSNATCSTGVIGNPLVTLVGGLRNTGATASGGTNGSSAPL